MTPEDRELLEGLRRQQLELRQALARLDVQMDGLEARVGANVAAPMPDFPPLPLPPIPVHDGPPPFFPPLPISAEVTPPHFPPLPPPPVPEQRYSIEFQFGRWLIGVGIFSGVILLVLIFGIKHAFVYKVLGPLGVISLSTAVSAAVVLWGARLEKRNRFFGRAVSAMALTWLYITAYAACYSDHYQIIHSSFVAGCLLVLWSAYVLLIAERRRSQALALLAILLAYYSTAINPMGWFTMGTDILLAGLAVILLIRNGWSALAYFALAGSYLAMLRRLVIDADGEFVFDSGRVLHFWPYAAYLTFTWAIFTAAVWFCGAPTFRGQKRFAFLTLNNGAWAGLLLFTSYISGYGHGPTGWILLSTGFILLITSRFVGWTDIEPDKVMAAYAAQGLGLFTGGILVVFTGMTRGTMLTLETLLLGCAGTFSADRVLLITTYFAAFFATVFLTWEIAVNAHHPWLLGSGGALVMLINAYMARSDIRHSPQARTTLVPGCAYYCTLAVGLIFTALCVGQNEDALPPALAITAVAITFIIYYYSIYELPPIAQVLLLTAQALVIFPLDTGEEVSWWTTGIVTFVTLFMITWWSRQRITRTSPGTSMLVLVYALALTMLAYETVRPWADLQGWMGIASLLSVAFLIWGLFTRVWQMAAAGQLFLAIALYHFFIPPGDDPFPWKWWAAPLLLAVVFSTARGTHTWLNLFKGELDNRHRSLRMLAYGYQLLALAMLIHWISAVMSPLDQVAVFIFLGMMVLSWNVNHRNLFGVRCSYVLTLLGLSLYLENVSSNALAMATFVNGLALLSLLVQPAMLPLRGKFRVTNFESWAVVLISAGAGLFFVTNWVEVRFTMGYLTMNWALYGLFLFLLGPLLQERRLRSCGIAMLVAAIGRAVLHDFWTLSSGYQILTAIALMFTTLSVGYLIIQSTDKFRK